MRPFFYTNKVKRPEENYIFNGVFGWDFLTVILAYAIFLDRPILVSISLLFYLLGFYSIYEIGYYENDASAIKNEIAPRVHPNFNEFASQFNPILAWVYGLVLLGVGAAIQAYTYGGSYLEADSHAIEAFMRNWVASIALVSMTRLTFRYFNSLRPRTRVVPMLALQLERTLGYAFMLPIGPIGIVLCMSHSFARWFPYLLYRSGYPREAFPIHIGALVLFACFAGTLFIVEDSLQLDVSFDDQFYVIAAYLGLRAAKQIFGFFRASQKW